VLPARPKIDTRRPDFVSVRRITPSYEDFVDLQLNG